MMADPEFMRKVLDLMMGRPAPALMGQRLAEKQQWKKSAFQRAEHLPLTPMDRMGDEAISIVDVVPGPAFCMNICSKQCIEDKSLERIDAMNRANMAHIIADPTALTVLKKCTSVNELVASLNWAGAECTREEGLRFLRTWEKLDVERESIEDDELDSISGGSWIIDSVKSMFECENSPKRKFMPKAKPNPLTIEMILDQMNE